MRRNPVRTKAFHSLVLQVESINWSGGHSIRIRRLVHRTAGNSPIGIRGTAIVRKAVHLARQIKGRSASVIVQFAEIVIEAAILLSQKDDVLDGIVGLVRRGR